ncbi:MAG: hypothetical protein JNL83_08985 [Myxococcales bacterium]|nr:hypothetical protein [Myxococcales bacterium]
MTKYSMVVFLGLALAGCPKKGGGVSMPGGGGGGGAPMAGTMAEAPTQAFPSTLDVKPACNQDQYLVLAVKEGQKFTVELTPSDGCVHVSVMKENGSTNDMPNAEMCAADPATIKPIEGVGQQGKTFISMHETGACKGISVNVAFKE